LGTGGLSRVWLSGLVFSCSQSCRICSLWANMMTLSVRDDFERTWWLSEPDDFERTWWLWANLMTERSWWLSEPNDFERTWWPWTYLMTLSVPNDWAYLMTLSEPVDFERTWRLWAYMMTLNVPDDFERTWWLWAYMMTLSVPDEGYSRNAPWTLNLISTILLTFSIILSNKIFYME